MDSISPYIFEVSRNGLTYEINYHYYDDKSIAINDKFVAYRCSSWVDAVNQLNQDLIKIGFPIYFIDSFQEKVEL